ncbi:3'-5' exonuclease [Candidatus Gracilibacteria bacterium]|nr:3'-5' exonuclease [Candidatus Gracilibacteria bacterium]NUJ98820.1 3'-5' exonuclease [Candidatus Gracilibacteria bacterium]
MKVFVFDTETTGFINKKENNVNLQPSIIQFAGILGEIDEEKNWKDLEKVNILINPKKTIPYESSQIHHIYDIDVKDAPFIEDIIDTILHYINTPDIIVGHNIEYDEDMIKLELKRLGREHDYRPKQICCTMKNTVNFCQIKGNGERFKYPKLGELHKHIFGEYFTGAHDALVDVEATLRCFIELQQQEIIKVAPKKEILMSLF